MAISFQSYYKIFVLLWGILFVATFIPSLIPHPRSITIFVMALSLILGKNISFNKKIFHPIILILFTCLFITMCQGGLYFYSYLIFSILFIAILGTMKVHELNKLVDYYLIIALVFSLCGLISSILINTDFVNYSHHWFSLTKATDGKIAKDMYSFPPMYSSPFNLGLVLTGSGSRYQMLGIEYFRSSGWSHEPTSASLFTTPALILFSQKKGFKAIICTLIIIFFLIACSSLSWFIGISITYALIYLSKKRYIFLITFLFLFGLTIYFLMDSELFNKFQLDSETPQLIIKQFDIFNFGVFYLITAIILSAFTLYILIIKKNIYGSIILFFIIVGSKGAWGIIFAYHMTMLFLYLCLKNINADHHNYHLR